jgi:hypothetical protein
MIPPAVDARNCPSFGTISRCIFSCQPKNPYSEFYFESWARLPATPSRLQTSLNNESSVVAGSAQPSLRLTPIIVAFAPAEGALNATRHGHRITRPFPARLSKLAKVEAR